MAVKATPAGATANWKTGFGGATQKYTDGINSVQVAPGQLAAAQQDVWANNTVAAKSRFAANVGAVSLGDWKNAAITTGAARLTTGAAKGEAKMATFMGKFLPDLANVVNSLPARGDFNANLGRFTSYATALHAKKGTYR